MLPVDHRRVHVHISTSVAERYGLSVARRHSAEVFLVDLALPTLANCTSRVCPLAIILLSYKDTSRQMHTIALGSENDSCHISVSLFPTRAWREQVTA
jgi:hypothetical protein